MLMEFVEGEFMAFGVFAPWNEEAAAAGVVGVGEKTQPMEVRDAQRVFGKGAENLMKIRRVVEGVALDEDCDVGETVVSLREVMQIGVGFAADVGKWYGVGDSAAFVIDTDREGARHATYPSEVFAVPSDDEFKPWLHGGWQRMIGRRW